MNGLTMVQWINVNRNYRSVSMSIFCIVRKNQPYPPTASESYGREAGRQAGRPADDIWVGFKILKFSAGKDYLVFYFVYYHLQYQNCISVSSCQIKLILRCVLKCKNSVAIFSCQSLLLGANVPNEPFLKSIECAINLRF